MTEIWVCYNKHKCECLCVEAAENDRVGNGKVRKMELVRVPNQMWMRTWRCVGLVIAVVETKVSTLCEYDVEDPRTLKQAQNGDLKWVPMCLCLCL